MLKDEREPSAEGEDERYTLFALLDKDHHQAEDGRNSEKAELEILTTAKKLVKVTEVFCPRHGDNLEKGEQDEGAAQHNPSFGHSGRTSSARDGSSLQWPSLCA